MLGKLIKHEFRATARIMLPMLAAVLVMGLLFGASTLSLRTSNQSALSIVFGLTMFLFVIAIIVASVMSVVLMVYRFYRNLLGNEGYLMFSLPVSVDSLVWAKLITSLVWFILTGVAIMLSLMLAVVIFGHSDLQEILRELPTWRQIRMGLLQAGMNPSDLWVLGIEFAVGLLISGLTSCLHFYAAMSLGQMFPDHKGLFSVLFFFGISILVSIISGIAGAAGFSYVYLLRLVESSTARQAMDIVQQMMIRSLILTAVEGVVLYLVTTFSLKKKLNLA